MSKSVICQNQFYDVMFSIRVLRVKGIDKYAYPYTT